MPETYVKGGTRVHDPLVLHRKFSPPFTSDIIVGPLKSVLLFMLLIFML